MRKKLPGAQIHPDTTHHGREHAQALAKVAVDIQDESNRLSEPQPQ